MTFNPNEHLMKLKMSNKEQDYLPVQWRFAQILDNANLRLQRSIIAQEALRVNGDPYADKYVARFLERIEIEENGCWLWKSTLNNKGYARLGMYRRLVLVHRWAYLLIRGAVPQGRELDHLCSTPNCVNPDHLEPVTHRENNLRGNTQPGIHARKTHCPEGHPYSEENTYRRPGKGSRDCRICKTKHTVESNHRMQMLRKSGGKTA